MDSVPAPLSDMLLFRHAELIEAELRNHIDQAIHASSTLPVSPSVLRLAFRLDTLFAFLFGTERSSLERYLFFAFAAPIARRLMFNHILSGDVALPSSLDKPGLLQRWLARVETIDPRCVLMIDLRYFCGLSVRETAATLSVSAGTVLHDLQFAKQWLRSYIGTSV